MTVNDWIGIGLLVLVIEMIIGLAVLFWVAIKSLKELP